MKKSNTLSKSILSVLLTAVLLLTTVSPVFAGVVIDEEEKLQYLYTFNNAVNSIKELKPSFNYKKTAGMDQDTEVYYDIKTSGDLSGEALRYLDIFVKAFFNPEAGVINNLFAVLTETDTDTLEKDIAKGVDTTYFLPKFGESYVSALTLDDEYTLRTENNLLNNALTINYAFPVKDLGNVKGSSLEKVFDLPSGSINPVIIGGTHFDDDDDPLTEVKFDDFTFTNAYVRATLDAEGLLVRYEQNISYEFSISFYDVIRIFNALTGIDLMGLGMAIANAIITNLGNEAVTERDVLKKSMMYIKYDVNTVLSDFDWTPRYFGDTDNDNDVDVKDARFILRNSVGLEEAENDEVLVYSDVNFDGVISAADSRHVLRTAVLLEERFSEVPEGESIKIIVILPPEEPEEPEVPEEPENPDEPENPETPDAPENPEKPDGSGILGDTEYFITAFIDMIFAIINAGKEHDFDQGLIAEIIVAIQALGKNENNNGTSAVLPE